MENTQDAAKQFQKKTEGFLEKTKWCGICQYPLVDGTCLNCEEEKKAEELRTRWQVVHDIQRLGGIRPYEDFTLETFDNKEAIEIAQRYSNLYIWGDRGTGKTHLATALIRKKTNGLMITPMTILRAIKDKILDARKEQDEINHYVNHTALCIDDLGVEKLTAHTKTILYEIINGRWINKKEGLIITSNLDPDQLSAQFEDDRITSRIIGLCKIVQLGGRDRRIPQ